MPETRKGPGGEFPEKGKPRVFRAGRKASGSEWLSTRDGRAAEGNENETMAVSAPSFDPLFGMP